MRYKSGNPISRRPGFDALEDRCLLNGDDVLVFRSAQILPAAVGPAVSSAPAAFAPIESEGLLSFGMVAGSSGDRFQPRAFEAIWPLGIEGSSPFPVEQNSLFQVSDNSTFQPGRILPIEPDAGFAIPAIIVFLIRAEPEPSTQFQFSPAGAPSAAVGPGAKTAAATVATDAAIPSPIVAPAFGAPAGAVVIGASIVERGRIQEAGSTAIAQAGSAAGLLPTQLLSYTDAAARGTTRLVSQGDALGGDNQIRSASPRSPSDIPASHSIAMPPGPAGVRSSSGYFSSLAVDQATELPPPVAADLIAGVLPFDRSSLLRAIDRFFEEFDTPGTVGLAHRRPQDVVFLSVTLASAATALEVVRRRWRHWTRGGPNARFREPLARGVHLGFPEVPGSWSSRLT
jgi:hypothetical protein